MTDINISRLEHLLGKYKVWGEKLSEEEWAEVTKILSDYLGTPLHSVEGSEELISLGLVIIGAYLVTDNASRVPDLEKRIEVLERKVKELAENVDSATKEE